MFVELILPILVFGAMGIAILYLIIRALLRRTVFRKSYELLRAYGKDTKCPFCGQALTCQSTEHRDSVSEAKKRDPQIDELVIAIKGYIPQGPKYDDDTFCYECKTCGYKIRLHIDRREDDSGRMVATYTRKIIEPGKLTEAQCKDFQRALKKLDADQTAYHGIS